MPKSQTTKSLYAIYLSTLCVLCFLLIAAQVVIQYALMQAIRTQNAYAVLNSQQLRTQRLVRNAILLLDTKGNRPGLVLSLYADSQAWEITQDGIDHGNAGLAISPQDFPASVHHRLNNARLDYQKMRTALHGLLSSATTGTATSKVLAADIAPIFYSGGVYSAALTSAASDLLTESNVYVANIRFIEFGLFLLCLLTLICEFTFVFQPTFGQMKTYLTQLHEIITQQEQALSQEEGHHVTTMPTPPQTGINVEEEEISEHQQKGLFDGTEEKHQH